MQLLKTFQWNHKLAHCLEYNRHSNTLINKTIQNISQNENDFSSLSYLICMSTASPNTCGMFVLLEWLYYTLFCHFFGIFFVCCLFICVLGCIFLNSILQFFFLSTSRYALFFKVLLQSLWYEYTII